MPEKNREKINNKFVEDLQNINDEIEDYSKAKEDRNQALKIHVQNELKKQEDLRQ